MDYIKDRAFKIWKHVRKLQSESPFGNFLPSSAVTINAKQIFNLKVIFYVEKIIYITLIALQIKMKVEKLWHWFLCMK